MIIVGATTSREEHMKAAEVRGRPDWPEPLKARLAAPAGMAEDKALRAGESLRERAGDGGSHRCGRGSRLSLSALRENGHAPLHQKT